MYKIYKLVLNGVPIYIGKTKELYYSVRRAKGYPSNQEVQSVIKECEYVTIEETDDASRERYWIDEYRKMGFKLFNKRRGDGITKEEKKELVKNWHKENADYMKAVTKKWREENKDKFNSYRAEYMREWRKKKQKINYKIWLTKLLKRLNC